MQTKYSVEDIANNILGEPMSWNYVFGEVKELIQDKTYSEFSDVVATFSLALYKHFPRIGKWKPKHAQNAFQRWIKRKTFWKKICEIHNLKFEKKCIKKGGKSRSSCLLESSSRIKSTQQFTTQTTLNDKILP